MKEEIERESFSRVGDTRVEAKEKGELVKNWPIYTCRTDQRSV